MPIAHASPARPRPGRAAALAFAALALAAVPGRAAGTYDPGASDSVIKIGNTMPYSGPASVISLIGVGMDAYFRQVNDTGGVNGRRIDFISLDDSYSPPRTVEQTRRLVEEDGVLLVFGALGTPTNAAVRPYLNARKVPQLFITTGALIGDDPQHFPWTMGFLPNYRAEGRVYARYILAEHPQARIGILYQNDDFGRDYLSGFLPALGERAKTMVSKQVSYEVTDPSLASQAISLRESGADTVFLATQGKAAAQAIRAVREQGWNPLVFLPTVATSINILNGAGLTNATGIISSTTEKAPADPSWAGDPASRAFLAWMKTYLPRADPTDSSYATGYTAAQALVEVLKRCGDTLTRANVLKQATNLRGVTLPLLLPGITINTSPTDYNALSQLQLERFDGRKWVLFGQPMTAR